MLVDMDTGKEIKPKAIKIESVKDAARGGLVFQRAAIKIVKKIPMFIPMSIEKAIIGLNKKFPGVEFTIFGKSFWDNDAEHLGIQEEFVIPKQEVSSGHIEYFEDPGIEYDTVIHKHPSGCHQFSSTDWAFINANCRHSTLWCDGKFWEATTTIFYKPYDCNIRLPAEVFTEAMVGVIPEGALDKITEAPTPDDFHISGIGGPYRRQNNRFSALDGENMRGFPDYSGRNHFLGDTFSPEELRDILGDEITDGEQLCEFIDMEDKSDMNDQANSKTRL